MGLDDFVTGGDDEDGGTEDEQQDEETTSESEPSGLDAFRTDTSRGGSGSETDSEDEDKPYVSLPTHKMGNMTVEERVRFVRDNYIPDYYPSYNLDDRWSYKECVELSCVCGNTFTFRHAGICEECERAYMDAGRTVVKKRDPYEDN